VFAAERAMATTDLHLVCLLDVLGFESLLRRLGLVGLHQKYASLVDYVKQQTGGLDVVPTPDGHVAVGSLVVGNAYFSDSLLFWTRYSKLAVPSFTHLVAEAVCFGLEAELPLRGAIAVGEAVLDADTGIFLGEPLVEVARTERTQQWIGASFGPSFSEPRFSGGFYLHAVLPYKSHYKDRTSRHATGMAVDWPRRWRESRMSDPRPLLRSLDRDPVFSAYYDQAVRFIDFSYEGDVARYSRLRSGPPSQPCGVRLDVRGSPPPRGPPQSTLHGTSPFPPRPPGNKGPVAVYVALGGDTCSGGAARRTRSGAALLGGATPISCGKRSEGKDRCGLQRGLGPVGAWWPSRSCPASPRSSGITCTRCSLSNSTWETTSPITTAPAGPEPLAPLMFRLTGAKRYRTPFEP